MGGLITLRYLMELNEEEVANVCGVISAPFLRVTTPLTTPQRILVNVVKVINPKFRTPFAAGFEKNLSHDEEYHVDRLRDKLCGSHATIGWLLQCEKAQAILQKQYALKLAGKVPTYWFIAGQDYVCSSDVMRDFVQQLNKAAAGSSCSHEIFEYPLFFHEIFQEKDRQDPQEKARKILINVGSAAAAPARL